MTRCWRRVVTNPHQRRQARWLETLGWGWPSWRVPAPRLPVPPGPGAAQGCAGGLGRPGRGSTWRPGRCRPEPPGGGTGRAAHTHLSFHCPVISVLLEVSWRQTGPADARCHPGRRPGDAKQASAHRLPLRARLSRACNHGPPSAPSPWRWARHLTAAGGSAGRRSAKNKSLWRPQRWPSSGLVGGRAPGRTRTCNLRIRSPLLYPLSYRGVRLSSVLLAPPDCRQPFEGRTASCMVAVTSEYRSR